MVTLKLERRPYTQGLNQHVGWPLFHMETKWLFFFLLTFCFFFLVYSSIFHQAFRHPGGVARLDLGASESAFLFLLLFKGFIFAGIKS